MTAKKKTSVFAIWKTVCDLILAEPRILIPFLILASVESIALWILASAPHFPVNIIMAPLIRNIWGGIYLHYPYIHELLPRLFYFAKIVIGIFVGAVTVGMAIQGTACARRKEKLNLKAAFSSVMSRYISLLLLSFLLFFIAHFAMKQPSLLSIKYFRAGHPTLLFLGQKHWFNIFIPVFNFALAVLLQALLVYTVPYVVLKQRKFAAAFVMGIGLFFKTAAKTLWTVAVPMCLFIPISMLKGQFPVLADKFSPEIVGFILLLGILAGTLVADALITIATTLLFIEATDEK